MTMKQGSTHRLIFWTKLHQELNEPKVLNLGLISMLQIILSFLDSVHAARLNLNGLGRAWANELSRDWTLAAAADCGKLYSEAERRVAQLVDGVDWCRDDAVAWLGGVLASHASCLDGLEESGRSDEVHHPTAENLTRVSKEALAVAWRRWKGICGNKKDLGRSVSSEGSEGILAAWNPATSKADAVVAQDGSAQYKMIGDAVAAVGGKWADRRVVIYVKSGVYNERVEIGMEMKNLMLVGDGIDKTIVTGNRNVRDGATTLSSATFGISGDGFWAKDITFENTAGPAKNQAVAVRSSSDLSVFYRCGFRGYQDTLLVHSLRQFYRDCQISGTVDFIFGDAAAVFQNCEILVRKPLEHQFNTVTAQGRDDPKANTGISIVNSRIAAAENLQGVESYLGRPWRMYSRTVVMETDLSGVIAGKGWKEWNGDFGISSVYYAEYNNTGAAADTAGRVSWPGFHVLTDYGEANGFGVANFIGGDSWIPATGVPFWGGL
ncbi:probable pectinesterase/pectinesterase inhibitor 36 [Andrographis paniculata]|uniref:probable pectinesterase/pectinesterase inhibitor 36 n=1 Tax=Andrographis paniculata TaxID=175694 RepID=UPI0021E731C7|nr:probable pectinesterase/pectinesterase inhibitor 36 [Andrographis paniculata]